MGLILVLAGIILVIWLARQAFSSAPEPTPPPPPQTEGPARSHKPEETYRPKPQGSRSGRTTIVFDPHKTDAPIPSSEALAGLHDAFTGVPLNPGLGLYQCTQCTVYYHAASVDVLRDENSSQCVACGAQAIVLLTEAPTHAPPGRDYTPNVVTLATFKKHFNRVVTFEGIVRSIQTSRRGTDYAVMFEDASWTKGLKLVFFRGAVRSVGGPQFIFSLAGHTVRVRGLLIRHPRFGPQIIISERSMILGVSP